VAELDPQNTVRSGQDQLPLDVYLRDDATLDNFLALPSVEPLMSALQAQLDSVEESMIYLYGPSGTGKSHLLQASCQIAGTSALYLPLDELRQYSAQDVLQGVARMERVCLDDIQVVLGDPKWEVALFNLFNEARQQGCKLVVSADASPRGLALDLEDLRSRLSWGIVFQLAQCDDEEKAAILQFRAHRRGMFLSPGVANYIVSRAPREMMQLLAVLNQLDKASLTEQRALSVPFVKKTLDW
jgi:DnaA family protein